MIIIIIMIIIIMVIIIMIILFYFNYLSWTYFIHPFIFPPR